MKVCGVTVAMPQGHSWAPHLVDRYHSERGNRLGPARRPGRQPGSTGWVAPSTDRAGTGRSRRSTPRPGKPVTWGRAAAESSREGCCNVGRCTGEYAVLRVRLARRARGPGTRGCRPSCTVGRRPILVAGSMICSTSWLTRRSLVVAWDRVAGQQGRTNGRRRRADRRRRRVPTPAWPGSWPSCGRR